MFQEKVRNLIDKVHALEKNPDKASKKLPSDSYFLSPDEILCYKRRVGDGRHPYSVDGRTLWAYSSGNMYIEESHFNIFLNSREGKEPYVCFFAGQKTEDGYFPVSLLGVARQPVEKDIKRYTIFTPEAVYYFTETAEFIACVRVFIDSSKRICFSSYIENISNKTIDTYLSAYINPFMRHESFEGFETKWYKECSRTPYGFLFKVTEYLSRESCLTHYAAVKTVGADKAQTTTSRFEFTGGMNESLNCSESLLAGNLNQQKNFAGFTDMAIAGSLNTLTLSAGESHVEDYIVAVADDAKAAAEQATAEETLDAIIAAAEEQTANREAKKLGIKFSGLTGALNGRDETLNNFLYTVTRQVEYCSRAKNSEGPFIGVRDIFQQVEASIAWIPDYCRTKIVEALNFIGDNGRAPRQYSYPANEYTAPKMDLRAFIDQGVWIISTVYTYLAYTGDYSILDEECGYYTFKDNDVLLCDKRDSVLEHLLLITDFLVSNLDENTGCLKALYGDWNDALDGLGKTQKPGQEFGNGVSVMASLQLYRNLGEISEICRRCGKFEERAAEYLKVRESLKTALIENAIVHGENGERKILHGWGDDKSFFVGSYKDNDGFSRDGLTANSFWILSGLYKEYGEIVPDILKAYNRLDSKYGLKTFEPYFPPENDKVGRITRLPRGTAENGATYIHATLFAIWSLLEIGESEKAWEQLYKILPITHEFISTTPFVMPNSYIHNEEKGFDGESMSDWYTGSACVLIKSLIGGVYGIRPTLDGVKIDTAAYMPCESAEITLRVKGSPLHLIYKKKGGGRTISANVESTATDTGIYLPLSVFNGKEIVVEITD